MKRPLAVRRARADAVKRAGKRFADFATERYPDPFERYNFACSPAGRLSFEELCRQEIEHSPLASRLRWYTLR